MKLNIRDLKTLLTPPISSGFADRVKFCELLPNDAPSFNNRQVMEEWPTNKEQVSDRVCWRNSSDQCIGQGKKCHD
jgi:hypothetical protein